MSYRIALAVVVAAAAAATAGSSSPAIAADPAPATTAAVQVITDEVRYVRFTLAAEHARLPIGFLYSAAAMNYTVGHVLAPVYGYLAQIEKQGLPQGTEQTLEEQAGICGNAEAVFAMLLGELGYRTRSVQFFMPNGDTHIAAEVSYGGGWHYFDPTYGVYYIRGGIVLPIRAVRRLPDAAAFRVADQSLLWTVAAEEDGAWIHTGIAQAVDPAARVVIGS